MTAYEYDTMTVKKTISASIFPLCFTVFLHYQFGFLPPLILSPINAFYDSFSQVY